jgi:hypothetical protein
MPVGLIAKLHFLVRSNSAAWRSFMSARASSVVCWLASGTLDTGVMLAVDLERGREPAVRNRSEPFLLQHQPQQVVHELDACSRSM